MMLGLGCSRSRAWLTYLGAFALACTGCATQRSGARPATAFDDSALHDSVADWEADAARYAPPPYAPANLRRVPLLFDEPSFPLPAFSRGEADRIREFQPIVYAAASTHAVAPDLVNGVIWVESRFQIRARSRRGSCGLMQLMPGTAREVARNMGRRYDPFDPDFNIHAGTYYLAQMLERFDDNMALALAAYNIGPAVISDVVRTSAPLPTVSRAYVNNVFDAARAFRAND